jgi:hypothetical protein
MRERERERERERALIPLIEISLIDCKLIIDIDHLLNGRFFKFNHIIRFGIPD